MWSCADNSVCLSNSDFCPWAQTLIRTRRWSWALSERHKWRQSCFQRKAARKSHETSIWFRSWPLVLITESRACCSKRHSFSHFIGLGTLPCERQECSPCRVLSHCRRLSRMFWLCQSNPSLFCGDNWRKASSFMLCMVFCLGCCL